MVNRYCHQDRHNMKFFLKKITLLFPLFVMGMLLACQREAADNDAKPLGAIHELPLVSGTLEISAEAEKARDPLSILFIMLRNSKGEIVAVKKILPPFQFPLNFKIEESDKMIAGVDAESEFKVSARVDKDGDANPTQKGDILGESKPELIKKNAGQVRIVLDQIVP